MMCRECGDPAEYLWDWFDGRLNRAYYCADCVATFERLGVYCFVGLEALYGQEMGDPTRDRAKEED
jgi:hypothetical protein